MYAQNPIIEAISNTRMANMNAQELLSESTPRSDATVDMWRDQVAPGVRALAKRMGRVVIASIGIPLLVTMVLAGALVPDMNLGEALGSGFALSLLLVVAPVWGIRKLVLRDIAATVRLVRGGTAYRASVVRRIVVRGSIPQVILAWDENGRRQGATFALTQKAVDADPDEIVVLARRHHSRVVAAFGSLGMSIGVRKRLWGKDRHQ